MGERRELTERERDEQRERDGQREQAGDQQRRPPAAVVGDPVGFLQGR